MNLALKLGSAYLLGMAKFFKRLHAGLKEHPLFCVWVVSEIVFLSIGVSLFEGRKHGDEELHLRVVENGIQLGHRLVPYLDGKPFFNKPPLLFWLIMAVQVLIQDVRSAGRIVVLGFTVIATTFTYLLSLKTHRSKSHALGATIVFSTVLGIFYFSRVAMLDIPLVASALAAVYFGWRYCEEKSARLFRLACFCLVIGMQWKGPVFGLFFIPIAVLFWIEKKISFKDLRQFWLEIVFLVLFSFSWQIGMYLKFGREFLNYFFMDQSLSRITYAAPGKLICFLLLGLFPWTFHVLSGFFDRKVALKAESRVPLALVFGNFIPFFHVGDPHFHWMLPAIAGLCFFPWLESRSWVAKGIQWSLGTLSLLLAIGLVFGVSTAFFYYFPHFCGWHNWVGLGASAASVMILLASWRLRFLFAGGLFYLASLAILYYSVIPGALSPLRIPADVLPGIVPEVEAPYFVVAPVDAGLYYVGEFGNTKNVVNLEQVGGRAPAIPAGAMVVVRAELLSAIQQRYVQVERWTKLRDGLVPVDAEVGELWHHPSWKHWDDLIRRVTEEMVMLRMEN